MHDMHREPAERNLLHLPYFNTAELYISYEHTFSNLKLVSDETFCILIILTVYFKKLFC